MNEPQPESEKSELVVEMNVAAPDRSDKLGF